MYNYLYFMYICHNFNMPFVICHLMLFVLLWRQKFMLEIVFLRKMGTCFTVHVSQMSKLVRINE